MILDLEGSVAEPRVTPPLEWMLSLASALLAGAVLLIVNQLPHEPLAPAGLAAQGTPPSQRPIVVSGPPRLALALPRDIAVWLPALERGDGSAMGPASPTLKAYRIKGTQDIVVVAALPGSPEVRRPADAPRDALSVHGQYAAGEIVEPSAVSVVRWTEHGMTYEISSRTLRPRDLAGLAERLR